MTAARRPARPAEATGGIGALVTAAAALLGAPTEVVAIVGTAAGLLPGVVTYAVAHGGVSGLLRAVWKGERS